MLYGYCSDMEELARKSGRPSTYTKKLADGMLNRLMEGESLRHICTEDGMPDLRTVMRWLESRPDFALRYSRTRDVQADLLDDRIQQEADDANEEDWQVRKLRIETMKWRAAKLAPKKYGEIKDTQVTVAVGVQVNQLSEEQRGQLMAKKRAAIERRKSLQNGEKVVRGSEENSLPPPSEAR